MVKVLFLIIFLTVSHKALSLTLNPSSFELRPSGSGSSYVFRVKNDTSELIAVQISTLTRRWHNNIEKNEPAKDKFQIFPTQLIIEANTEKSFRVRWLGEKKIKQEQAYRLVVEQLPISFSKTNDGSAMKVLHKVVASLYVTPPNSEAKLAVSHVKKELLNGQSTLSFMVENTGSKHILLNDARLSIHGEKRVDVKSEHLSQLSSQNVLAGASLRVSLPWPDTIGTKTPTIKTHK